MVFAWHSATGCFLETPLPLDELVAQTQLAPRLGDTRVTPSSILTAGPLFFILRAVPVPSPATSIPGWATEDRPKVLLVEVRVAADSSAAAGANQVRDHLGFMCGRRYWPGIMHAPTLRGGLQGTVFSLPASSRLCSVLGLFISYLLLLFMLYDYSLPLTVARLCGNQAFWDECMATCGCQALRQPGLWAGRRLRPLHCAATVCLYADEFVFAEATSGTALISPSVATAGRICDDIRCGQFVPVSHLALLGVRGSAHGEFSGNEATCAMRSTRLSMEVLNCLPYEFGSSLS